MTGHRNGAFSNSRSVAFGLFIIQVFQDSLVIRISTICQYYVLILLVALCCGSTRHTHAEMAKSALLSLFLVFVILLNGRQDVHRPISRPTLKPLCPCHKGSGNVSSPGMRQIFFSIFHPVLGAHCIT